MTVLAWVGVDGSLLKPIQPYRTEDFKDIMLDLEPTLQTIKASRTQHGLVGLESAPVFHATDSYGKHRLLLREAYHRVWPELSTTVRGSSARGDAVTASSSSGRSATTITGDPVHDWIALRKCVPPSCNDGRDFVADHKALLERLSLPPRRQSSDAEEDEVPTLTPNAQTPLKSGVADAVGIFKQKVQQDGEAAAVLRAFLVHPGAQTQQIWINLFGAAPPSNLLVRLLRRMGSDVPASCHRAGFATQFAFRAEAQRIEKWYSK